MSDRKRTRPTWGRQNEQPFCCLDQGFEVTDKQDDTIEERIIAVRVPRQTETMEDDSDDDFSEDDDSIGLSVSADTERYLRSRSTGRPDPRRTGRISEGFACRRSSRHQGTTASWSQHRWRMAIPARCRRELAARSGGTRTATTKGPRRFCKVESPCPAGGDRRTILATSSTSRLSTGSQTALSARIVNRW